MPNVLDFNFVGAGCGDLLGGRGIDEYGKDGVECIEVEVWQVIRMLDVFLHLTLLNIWCLLLFLVLVNN